jgi:copper resistance protein C
VTAVLLLAGALLVGFGSAPAAAHAVLEKTSPVDQSTVDTVPGFVSLTFDEAPQAKFSTIHITGPDGQRKDSGPIALNGAVASEHVSGSRPAGRYVVDWRVVSDDGHPISGQFTFTASTAATTIAVANPGKHGGGGPDKANATVVVLSVIAGLVVIGGALALYAQRRHRGNSPALAEGPADE